MSSQIDIRKVVVDVLSVFGRTLTFFQNIGILQAYSFNYSDVFFIPSAENYLDNFIALLEEVQVILIQLQEFHKKLKQSECNQITYEDVNTTSSNNNVHQRNIDTISSSHFIQSSGLFVSEQLIVTPQNELSNYITPSGLLSHFVVPEIPNEPVSDSSWVATEQKECKQQEHSKKQLADKDNFQCTVCNKVLSSKTSLNLHQATHTGQKLFCCEHCGKLFTTNPNLAAHLTRQHNLNTESANSCKECGKLFVRKSALDMHMKCHLGLKPWACNVCSKTFTQKVTRDTHQLTHTRDYKYCCNECGKQFPTKAKLNYHSKTHGEPQFMCNLCDKKFATKQYLTAHYRTHDTIAQRTETGQCRLDTVSTQIVGSKPFNCSQCNRSFPSQQKFTLHTKKHNLLSARFQYLEKCKLVLRQKYPCEICGKEFLLKSSLSHHQRQKHTLGLSEQQHRPYSCHLCHKSFTLRSKAKLHMNIHTQQEQHACGVCGRLFRRKDSLQRHMALHSNSANIVCSVCSHVSASMTVYKEHAKTHAAHYKCSHCSKLFKSKTALVFHTHSHEGKFKYQCRICGKQFVRKVHYRGHLHSHSTDRPYKCDSCGKGFKDNKTCREHTKRVHSQSFPLSVNQVAAAEAGGCPPVPSGQLAITSLLAGDDATYGQTYDQFQACIQLQ